MKEERITSYDVFRGLLLIGMVVFHLVVNLSDIKFDQNYFYLVPLGFMLFLGVILGRFLGGRSKKVMVLGAKLAVIFIVFNIPNFISKDYTPAQLVIGDQGIFSFEILLPMSIMAFVSIGLDRFVKGRVTAVILSGALLFILTYLHVVGVYSYNLSFLIYGVVGYLIGGNLDLDGIARRMSGWAFLGVIGASLVPFLAIGRFGIVEILVILQVLALYFLTAEVFGKNKFLILLGKNSLALYVLHIVLIRIVVSLFFR